MAADMRHASVRLHGLPAGTLSEAADGSFGFSYLPEWVDAYDAGSAYPLSVALPTTARNHPSTIVHAWFAGLLPEGDGARAALGRVLGVAGDDTFGLLLALGRDCPGAVSILPEDAPVVPDDDLPVAFELCDEARLADLVAELPRRPLFVDADGELRLSLAGVGAKAGVLRVDGRLALPRGGTPSSDILKPDLDGLPGSALTEHFCLALARDAGIDAAHATVRRFGEHACLLIARFDRVLRGPEGARRIGRLHQEDAAQALGVPPQRKYEREGGPGWRHLFGLADQTVDPLAARRGLLARAVFQYLIGNPDAHAKNYALVRRAAGLRLSPLYDVNNAAAFRRLFKETRPRLAMFIGGERNPDALTEEHWRTWAAEVRLHPDLLLATLRDQAMRLPDLASALRKRLAASPADTPLLDTVVDDIADRCGRWA